MHGTRGKGFDPQPLVRSEGTRMELEPIAAGATPVSDAVPSVRGTAPDPDAEKRADPRVPEPATGSHPSPQRSAGSRVAAWWGRRSVATKILLLIQAMLVAVLIAAQTWLMDRFRASILHSAESRTEALAAGVINGMNMLMLTGTVSDPELRKLYIRKMRDADEVTDLRIIRAQQVQDQFGPGLAEEQAKDDLDRLAIATKVSQFRLDERGTRPTLRAVVPFVVSTNFRGTNCLQCHHVEVGSVNGAASITVDLSRDYAAIAGVNRWMWGGQALLQVLLLLFMFWFVHRVLRPLRKLESAMVRVELDGDLSSRPPELLGLSAGSGDELGRLSATFNRMTSALFQKMQALREAREMQNIYLEQSAQEKARLASLLSVMDIGILFVSRENWIIHTNPTFFRIWDIPVPPDLGGCDASTFFEMLGAKIRQPADRPRLDPFRNPAQSRRVEVTLDDGTTVRLHNHEVSDQGGDGGGWLWVFEDISDDRRTAERLTFFAERDPLTGLRNRRRFHEDLERALAHAQRSKGKVALLLLDVDGFKYVNDTFGHGAGDAILTRISSEVGRIIRPGDGLFRWGGDEFTILIQDADPDAVAAFGGRIVEAVSRIPFEQGASRLRVTASLGIALYPDDAQDAREMMAHADAAMYRAKEDGRNRWRLYDSECDVSGEMLSRMSLESSLDDAIANDGLCLHFQGIYRPDGALSHLEALVRMVDPQDPARLLSPGEFIPVAERSGRIRALDLWVVRQAVTLLARSPWPLSIAVNVSGRSIDEGKLAASIEREIARQGIEPHRLILELTETAAVGDLQHLRGFTQTMRRAGCRICLDDFGSGFSSFVYLRHIDADILKIDGAFIRDLPRDPQNQVLVRAVVAVAQALGKQTVAEYVEDAATLELLAEIGVDLIQGYVFDKPVADHPAFAGPHPISVAAIT
jgi:diguanylate cyclase (GGDEF)-like protein